MDLTKKCYKYIVLGRRETVKNLKGEDRVKVITEIFTLTAGTSKDTIVEYDRRYYREIVGGRGTDVGNMADSGEKYLSLDRTIGDFMELNFTDPNGNVTNTLLKFKTYRNRSFLTRSRKTSFHEEQNIAIGEV